MIDVKRELRVAQLQVSILYDCYEVLAQQLHNFTCKPGEWDGWHACKNENCIKLQSTLDIIKKMEKE